MGMIQEFEQVYWEQGLCVLGIDEAGRGPMAGPCVVAGVIFPKGYDNSEINDSKKLSETKRRLLFEVIKKDALYFDVEIVSVEDIDVHNIYQATKYGMMRIANRAPKAMVLSDALAFDVEDKEVLAVVKGDMRSISIAAASILAKTIRDDIMIALDAKYPEYGFAKHKGYGTKIHKEAILKYGRTPEHRKSFKFKEEDQMSLDI